MPSEDLPDDLACCEKWFDRTLALPGNNKYSDSREEKKYELVINQCS